MSTFSSFSSFIEELLKSESFKNKITDDILLKIETEGEKKKIIECALRCVFGQPQGVGQMDETKKYSHIKNNRNWQPFCAKLLDHVKTDHKGLYDELTKVSSLFLKYGKFWPENDQELTADVEKARAAMSK